MTDTQWGRKETIVRPPHYPVYSFGAVFVALMVTVALRLPPPRFCHDVRCNATTSPAMPKRASSARCARAASTSLLR